MKTKIYSAALSGLETTLVEFEIKESARHRSAGELSILGMGVTTANETKTRIINALFSNKIHFPDKDTLIVNSFPSNERKEGSHYDLPIAISISIFLNHISKIPTNISDIVFAGELSLSGDIKPVKGLLVVAASLSKLGKTKLITSMENAYECSAVPNIKVLGVKNLQEIIDIFNQGKPLSFLPVRKIAPNPKHSTIDYKEVKGQTIAKRGLQVAVAGKHHLLMIGTPGSGKTMLAKRIPTIMPPMSHDEILEVSKIYSTIGLLHNSLIVDRPFRDPHHTVTSSALIGGGKRIMPGEVTKAHNGVLFLDEVTEIKSFILDLLRQPMEDESVHISRAHGSISFPASFILIAASNPCPCGYWGSKTKQCSCSSLTIKRYLDRISGPILDRIDIQIPIQSVEYDDIIDKTHSSTSSQEMLEGILKARNMQHERFNGLKLNSQMNVIEIERHCILNEESKEIIKTAFIKLNLSMRSYHKTLKLARTIADLDQSESITTRHIKEALSYRFVDKILTSPI